jgi:Ca2+-binding RTX toxin-like protein
VGFSFTVPADTFADVDAGDSLTYATGALPSWLSYNAATRTFSGTPGSAHLGVVSIQLIATDSAGAQMSDAFNITVGAAPNQILTGTAGDDTLNGASGNDTINGLAGADAMAGGLGDDAYFVDNAGDQVIEAAGAGDDTVNASISHTLAANVENLVLTGTSNISAIGNSLDNWLTGNSGKNTLAGGAGNDTYVVTQSNDSVVENAGNGADTVRASITYTLGNNVENLVLTGSSNLNGTGNTADNWLTGNAGNNILRGQGGADSISGGAGNDTLTGGSGLDTFWFLGAPGTANADHITDFGSGERLYLEDLVHPGIGAEGNFAPNDARFFAAAGASGGADASDRVIYDTATGRLYFDADGNGAAAPSLVAILDNLFALSASNITVI